MKLDNLKEDKMKEQIGVIMSLAPETFSRLRTLAKNIKDFQSQMKKSTPGQIDRGTEFGLDFDEEGGAEKTERDARGNVRHVRSQYDVEMVLANEDLEVGLANEVLEEAVDEGGTEGGPGKANQTRTPSQRNKKIRRPKDRAQGIQSVLLKERLEVGREPDSEDEVEESQAKEPTFDRGLDFLDKHLQAKGLSEEALRELVEILGKEDDGECQDQLITFVEAHEEVLNSDVSAIKEIYKNREELLFNLSLELFKENPEAIEKVIVRMKESELGRAMLEQKARLSVAEGTENSGEKIGKIILESKEMQELLQKSDLLERQIEGAEALDNETLAGLGKTTFHMKFKVKRSTVGLGRKIKMPRGTTKLTEKGYEVVKMPAETRKRDFDIKIKRVKDVLPEYFHSLFGEIEKLNNIQVKLISVRSLRINLQLKRQRFDLRPHRSRKNHYCFAGDSASNQFALFVSGPR